MKPTTYLRKAFRLSDGYNDKGNFKTKEGKLNGEIFPYDRGGFSSNGALALVDYNYSGEFSDLDNPIERLKANKGDLTCRFAVTKRHFERMIKCVNSVRSMTLRLDINGSLEVYGCSDVGQTYGALANGDNWNVTKTRKAVGLYRKIGGDSIFYVDPKYLLDALSGFNDILIVSIHGDLMILQDDNREAWIMGMRPK